MRGETNQTPDSEKVRPQVTVPDHREQKCTSPVTDVVVAIMQRKYAGTYRTETCHKCLKVGHIARMCKTKNSHGHPQYVAENSSPNDTAGSGNDELFRSYSMNTVYTTNTVGNGKKDIRVNVKLEGTLVAMQLDTGAAITLVSEIVYKKHLSHLPLKES